MVTWLKALAVGIFAVLAPIHATMATAGALIFMDLILGVMAARKRGEKITSAGLRRTVTKMTVYQLAIVSGFLCQHYMLGDEIPIVKLAAAAIAMVEMKSIVENLDAVNGEPIFKKILTSLGSQNDKKDNS